MKNYQYRAIHSEGQVVIGSLEAFSKSDAQKKLNERRMLAIKIIEQPIYQDTANKLGIKEYKKSILPVFFRQKQLYKLTQKQILQWTESLADLMDAHVLFSKAFEILINQEPNIKKKQVFEKINKHIQAGDSLSYSFSQAYGSFDNLYISMIRSGESSGRMQSIVRILADYLSQNYKLKQKVLTALLYPCLVLSVSLLMLSCLLIFIIPQFAITLKSLISVNELPKVTQFLLNASAFFRKNFHFIISLIITSSMLVIIIFRKMKMNIFFLVSSFTLKIPLVGKSIMYAELSKIAHVLIILLESGVIIDKALVQVIEIAQTKHFQTALKESLIYLNEGEMLSVSFEKTKNFPIYFCLACKVGEETGELSQSLNKAAIHYKGQLESALARFLTVLEPSLILILAVIVGILVITLFMPILQSLHQLSSF